MTVNVGAHWQLNMQPLIEKLTEQESKQRYKSSLLLKGDHM